jgi:hypothetical protein
MAVVSGGTTLIDNGALDAGVPTGNLILLSTQTASASASISFTSGIDSTYDSYVFKFINIHPETYQARFGFQADTGSNTNYNQTMTTTWFYAYNPEDGGTAFFAYFGDADQAQGTSFKNVTWNVDNGNDSCTSGILHLFNPSNTTFVKHFTANMNLTYGTSPVATENVLSAGYINTTTAINKIQFKFSSGNIDDGIIKMYGVK